MNLKLEVIRINEDVITTSGIKTVQLKNFEDNEENNGLFIIGSNSQNTMYDGGAPLTTIHNFFANNGFPGIDNSTLFGNNNLDDICCAEDDGKGVDNPGVDGIYIWNGTKFVKK